MPTCLERAKQQLKEARKNVRLVEKVKKQGYSVINDKARCIIPNHHKHLKYLGDLTVTYGQFDPEIFKELLKIGKLIPMIEYVDQWYHLLPQSREAMKKYRASFDAGQVKRYNTELASFQIELSAYGRDLKFYLQIKGLGVVKVEFSLGKSDAIYNRDDPFHEYSAYQRTPKPYRLEINKPDPAGDVIVSTRGVQDKNGWHATLLYKRGCAPAPLKQYL